MKTIIIAFLLGLAANIHAVPRVVWYDDETQSFLVITNSGANTNITSSFNTLSASSISATNFYVLSPKTDNYATNELVPFSVIVDLITSLSPTVLYGSTNLLGVAALSPAGTMIATNIGTLWAVTNALDVGTNYIGTWYWTNAVVSFIPSGLYYGHFWSYYSGLGNPDVSAYFEIITSDGATTNVVDQATTGIKPLSSTLSEYILYTSNATNYYVPTVSNYFGIRMYAIRSGGSSASIIIQGGSEMRQTFLRVPYINR
jgi:hypothetical protein